MSGQSPFTPDQAGADAQLAPSQNVAVTTTSAAFQINKHSGSVRIVTDATVYARLGGPGVSATTADTKLPRGTHVLGKGGSAYIALIADSTASVNICTGEGSLSSGDGDVGFSDLFAGEDPDFDIQRVKESATQAINVLPSQTDKVMGSIGAASDYLQDVLCVVSASAGSRVVLKEGNPSPKKALTTHASTPSTTTQINTAVNVDSVPADFYMNHLVRVGTGPYRKILSHGAFAANAVNQYNLDQALPAVPAAGVAVIIESPELVTEIMPVGVEVRSHPVPIKRHCNGAGWRLSTDTGVSLVASGDFDNV